MALREKSRKFQTVGEINMLSDNTLFTINERTERSSEHKKKNKSEFNLNAIDLKAAHELMIDKSEFNIKKKRASINTV